MTDITALATWVSSDTEVATIDGGLATDTGKGNAEITATPAGITNKPIALTVTLPLKCLGP